MQILSASCSLGEAVLKEGANQEGVLAVVKSLEKSELLVLEASHFQSVLQLGYEGMVQANSKVTHAFMTL